MYEKISAGAFLAFVCLLQGSRCLFNGILANQGEFPYTVIVGGRDGRVCGGSIISSSWVLTAAHCILFDNGTLMTNVSIDMGTEVELAFMLESERKVEILVPHPDYNKRTKLHDIALLKVSPPFLWSRDVLPIQLETNLTMELQGTVIISGYGETFHEEDFSVSDSRQLRAVKVPLYSKKCLNEGISNRTDLANFMFCTFGQHSGACNGDSGSPVVFRGVQIGIAVLAAGCSPPTNTVHVKVSAYIDWIQEKCNGCLAESEAFDVFNPEPAREPTQEDLKYQVLVTVTKSIYIKPAALLIELDWMWGGSIISEFWVLTSNVSGIEVNGVSVEDLQLWVIPMGLLDAKYLEWVPVIRMIADESKDIALAEVQVGFQWSESVEPVQLELEPMNDSVTGEMLVWELGPESTEGDESYEPVVSNLNFASSADCSILLKVEQAEFLCGHVENLHGLQFTWHIGSPVVLENGNQIGISGQGNTTSPYQSFDLVQIHIEWIQENCGGCLENYNDMTRQCSLKFFATFSFFVAAVIVFAVGVFSLCLGLFRLVRRCRSRIAQAGTDVEVAELAYKFESRV